MTTECEMAKHKQGSAAEDEENEAMNTKSPWYHYAKH